MNVKNKQVLKEVLPSLLYKDAQYDWDTDKVSRPRISCPGCGRSRTTSAPRYFIKATLLAAAKEEDEKKLKGHMFEFFYRHSMPDLQPCRRQPDVKERSLNDFHPKSGKKLKQTKLSSFFSK